MNMIQSYETVKNAFAQATGEELKALDLNGAVQEGNAIMSNANGQLWDALHKALFDQIYKIVIGIREFQSENSTVLRSEEIFGAILEKVYIEPTDAVENPSWKLKNGQSVDPFKVTLAEVKTKFFSDRTTWEVPYTISDTMLKTAFLNPNQLAAYLTGYEMQAKNSFEIQLDNVVKWTQSNFIRLKHNATKGINEIPLVTNYNTAKGLTGTSKLPTGGSALLDKDFIVFLITEINKYAYKISKPSRLFNTEGYLRYTRPDVANLRLLADVAAAIDAYKINARQPQLINLPKLEVTPYWQGSGEKFTFDDCAKVIVSNELPSVDDDGEPVTPTATTVSNVIGLMYDDNAMGVSAYNRRVTSQYNGHGEYNNYWMKADVGLYNDTSENGLVFTLN